MTRYLFAILVAVAACGGGDDFGQGTNTLLVQATVDAQTALPGATQANQFTTDFRVEVQRRNAQGGLVDVTDATVTIGTNAGPMQLQRLNQGSRVYSTGIQTGYQQTFSLDVTAGTDNLLGVKLAGPGIHSLTAPLPGAVITGGGQQPIDVRWKRDQPAETTTIITAGGDIEAQIEDTGQYLLQPGTYRYDPQAPQETITIVRSNELFPVGALPGSIFRVRVQNSVNVTIQP